MWCGEMNQKFGIDTHTLLYASQAALVLKTPPADAGDRRATDLTSGLGSAPGGGHSEPLQASRLDNLGQRSLAGYSP